MKFLHLGDLHIGKSLGDFDLIEDQAYILDQILEIAKEKQVDGILIAGDVYDKSIPSEAAVRLFDDFINKLVANQLKTFIISGNHDSDERLHFGSSLFTTNGVYISAKYDGSLYKQTFTDEQGPINIYLMPFVKASQVKRYYPEEEIVTYDDAVRVLLAHSEINPAERNLLVAHQFVAGHSADASTDPVLGGSEGLSVKNVGTVERIGADCFELFDYVALGHIHSPQAIGREQVRYSGSPLKYSLSEVNNVKSVPVVTVGAKGQVELEFVPLNPKRDLRHIKGLMDNLLHNVTDPEDFIYVTLTDEDFIPDAMGLVQQYYPNTVKLDYDNSRTKQVEQIDISDITKGRSFTEMISDFYLQMYGHEISEEELALMEQVAGEAGVANETN